MITTGQKKGLPLIYTYGNFFLLGERFLFSFMTVTPPRNISQKNIWYNFWTRVTDSCCCLENRCAALPLTKEDHNTLLMIAICFKPTTATPPTLLNRIGEESGTFIPFIRGQKNPFVYLDEAPTHYSKVSHGAIGPTPLLLVCVFYPGCAHHSGHIRSVCT